MSVPAGTKFVGINPSVDTQEKKSVLSNSYSEIYTIEDILSGIPTSSVNYANVFFVDAKNGNDATGTQDDFTKPFLTVYAAAAAAFATSPTADTRSLVYVRPGIYYDEDITFKNYVDFYCDPNSMFEGYSRFNDLGVSADAKFMGYAKFNIYSYSFPICKATGATSKIYFEIDQAQVLGGIFEIQNGASLYFKARKVDADAFNSYNSAYCRGGGNIVVEISEEYKSYAQLFKFVQFSGKIYVTCPRMFLKDGGGIPANFKQAIMVDANAGGEAVINGNLYADPLATTYYGSNSAMITRWSDSWMTLRFNGGIFAENQLAVNAQGTSVSNRTIINGDVRTNMQVAYVGQSSRVVFRNGTLMNWNTEATSISSLSPILNINQNAVVFVENCHLHNLGTGGYAAIWKMSTASSLNVYNSVYSGEDAIGLFIKNSVAGTPTNNVRLLNTRATKALDTNITDLLSPTGFVQDANILSINFI